MASPIFSPSFLHAPIMSPFSMHRRDLCTKTLGPVQGCGVRARSRAAACARVPHVVLNAAGRRGGGEFVRIAASRAAGHALE